ncbi:MAG: DNA polymerase III subunit delta [Treponema sp.]|nr:DNA polymerase III subunit delta [Treponema sp.]
MTAPVYLYTGPEFGLRNEAVEAVKASLEKKYGSSDSFVYYAADTRIEDIVSQLRTESLFTPATFIVLRGAEGIKKKEDISLLAEWVASVTPSAANASPSDASVLVLVSDEISVDSKLEKLVPAANKKQFWEMFDDRKEAWLHDYFRKNGYALEPDAAEAILDMVENNTEALRAECSRFFLCFPKEHVISSEDVEQILAHNREESAFTLFDAMADGSVQPPARLENALSILQKILLTKSNSPVMLIAGLASCFRKLALWHQLHAGGAYVDDFALKTNGFGGKTIRAQYAKASRVWGAGQCAAIIALLSKTDMEIRSSGSAFTDTQLTILLFEIIIKKGASAAVYQA